MSLIHINPQSLDQKGDIQSNTRSDTTQGSTTQSWTNEYTGVYFGWLAPLAGRAKEINEGEKTVAEQRRSALLRLENRTITPKMRLVVSAENWHIEAVRPYKGSRNWIVLDVFESDK